MSNISYIDVNEEVFFLNGASNNYNVAANMKAPHFIQFKWLS
jgi:hypothetical protein